MKNFFGERKFSGRRLARVLVMEILYRYDLLSENPENILSEIMERENPPDEVKDFAQKLLSGVISNLEEIDSLIREKCRNWEMERIAPVDKALLRMAIGEMMTLPDVPYKVSITEAVEIAKIFSKEDSGRFVNGILDAVADELGLKKGGK
jgi:N utilization substance protein B